MLANGAAAANGAPPASPSKEELDAKFALPDRLKDYTGNPSRRSPLPLVSSCCFPRPVCPPRTQKLLPCARVTAHCKGCCAVLCLGRTDAWGGVTAIVSFCPAACVPCWAAVKFVSGGGSLDAATTAACFNAGVPTSGPEDRKAKLAWRQEKAAEEKRLAQERCVPWAGLPATSLWWPGVSTAGFGPLCRWVGSGCKGACEWADVRRCCKYGVAKVTPWRSVLLHLQQQPSCNLPTHAVLASSSSSRHWLCRLQPCHAGLLGEHLYVLHDHLHAGLPTCSNCGWRLPRLRAPAQRLCRLLWTGPRKRQRRPTQSSAGAATRHVDGMGSCQHWHVDDDAEVMHAGIVIAAWGFANPIALKMGRSRSLERR